MKIISIILVISIITTLFETRIDEYISKRKIANLLNELPSSDYKVLDHIIFKINEGIICIDYVVISIYGIYVIQYDSGKGVIIGNDFVEKWSRNMYGKCYLMPNLLLQNEVYIKVLAERLGISPTYFESIAAFANRSTIKVLTNKHVIYINQLDKVIKRNQVIKFTHEEVEDIIKTIKCF